MVICQCHIQSKHTNISNGITQTSKLQLNKPNEHSILQAASRHARMFLEHGATSSLVWYKNPPLVQSKTIYGGVDSHSDRVNLKPAKKKRNFQNKSANIWSSITYSQAFGVLRSLTLTYKGLDIDLILQIHYTPCEWQAICFNVR